MIKKSGHLAWIGACVFLLGYEVWALTFDGQTLSRAMYDATTAWPPLIFLIGLVVGMLVSHFWWHWDIKNKKGGG